MQALLYSNHNLFQPCKNDSEEDPISLKKLRKLDGAWMERKDILGWTFNGKNKTMKLKKEKLAKLIEITKAALRSKHGMAYASRYSTK